MRRFHLALFFLAGLALQPLSAQVCPLSIEGLTKQPVVAADDTGSVATPLSLCNRQCAKQAVTMAPYFGDLMGSRNGTEYPVGAAPALTAVAGAPRLLR
jgi:hypothetical protein